MARQVANQAGYAAGYSDPVRPINPYSPTALVTTGQASRVPIMGVAALAGVVLLFEHFRRKRGK